MCVEIKVLTKRARLHKCDHVFFEILDCLRIQSKKDGDYKKCISIKKDGDYEKGIHIKTCSHLKSSDLVMLQVPTYLLPDSSGNCKL